MKNSAKCKYCEKDMSDFGEADGLSYKCEACCKKSEGKWAGNDVFKGVKIRKIGDW